jgi:hypothetical protein
MVVESPRASNANRSGTNFPLLSRALISSCANSRKPRLMARTPTVASFVFMQPAK